MDKARIEDGRSAHVNTARLVSLACNINISSFVQLGKEDLDRLPVRSALEPAERAEQLEELDKWAEVYTENRLDNSTPRVNRLDSMEMLK